MLHTSGYFADWCSISSNWSVTMSANSRPECWRKTSAGLSLSSIEYGTDRIGPARVRIQNGWSSAGQSMT